MSVTFFFAGPKDSETSSSSSTVEEMDSDCESVDSGLEESGHSNLELEQGLGSLASLAEASEGEEGGHVSESIYENADVLKQANAYLTPVTAAIEKYQFGGQLEEGEEGEEDEQEEEEHVPFPPLDLSTKKEERGNTVWGVRQVGARGLSPALRTTNPTEDKIAKEIRELKEREEELVRRRDSKSPSPAAPSPTPPTPEPKKQEPAQQEAPAVKPQR